MLESVFNILFPSSRGSMNLFRISFEKSNKLLFYLLLARLFNLISGNVSTLIDSVGTYHLLK